MKRNLDLQTKILQQLEEANPNDEIRALEGYSHTEFCYNARQLQSQGLITIVDFSHKTDPLACTATGLTPKGHDLLDQTRTKWRKRAKSAISHGAQITFEAILRTTLEHFTP